MEPHTGKISNADWVMAGASLLFFIGSLLPNAQASAFGITVTADAWHWYGTLGVLLGLVGIGLWVAGRFGYLGPAGPEASALARYWPMIAAAAILGGTIVCLIRVLTYEEGVGVAYGLIILMIGGVLAAACSAMRGRVDALAARALASAQTARQNAQAAREQRAASPEPSSASDEGAPEEGEAPEESPVPESGPPASSPEPADSPEGVEDPGPGERPGEG